MWCVGCVVLFEISGVGGEDYCVWCDLVYVEVVVGFDVDV